MNKLALAVAGFAASISAANAQESPVLQPAADAANYQLPSEPVRPVVMRMDARITPAASRDADDTRYRLTTSPLASVFEPRAASPAPEAWRSADQFDVRDRRGPRNVGLGIGYRAQLNENMSVTSDEGGVVAGRRVVASFDGPQ